MGTQPMRYLRGVVDMICDLKRLQTAGFQNPYVNPNAMMHDKPLTEVDYDNTRWIVEPLRLPDNCPKLHGVSKEASGSGTKKVDKTYGSC